MAAETTAVVPFRPTAVLPQLVTLCRECRTAVRDQDVARHVVGVLLDDDGAHLETGTHPFAVSTACGHVYGPEEVCRRT
jgi:hypothetical protein